MPIAKASPRQAVVYLLFLCALLSVSLLLAACESTAPPATATSGPPASGGAAVFMRNCNVCHPGGGKGSGPSVIERAPTLSDEQLRALVRHGKDRMPPYSPNVISDAQLTELVAYMRALK